MAKQMQAQDTVPQWRDLREWVELVAELAHWEARLGQGGSQEGLRDALASLTKSLHADFAEYVRVRYPKWLQDASGDRPPLSPDVLPEFLAPLVRSHGKALFVLVDCLRLDQWELLRPLITEMFDVEVSHYFSILPTATPFARNAIFAGLFPAEIAARHPEWSGERDDESLNAHEAELLAEQMAEVVSPKPAVRYEKVATAAEGEEVLRKLPGYLAQPGVTALVFNFVDQLTHGRGEHAILYEVARDFERASQQYGEAAEAGDGENRLDHGNAAQEVAQHQPDQQNAPVRHGRDELRGAAGRRPVGQRHAEQFGPPVEQADVSIIVPLYQRIDFVEHQFVQFAADPARAR